MDEDAHGLDSGRWRHVDEAGDPDFFIAYLDRAAANLKEARDQVARALQVTPGCSVLDVGSGAGQFLIELAGAVPDLRTVGIDSSRALVAAAAARARAAAPAVEFRLGDGGRLDFPDGSF